MQITDPKSAHSAVEPASRPREASVRYMWYVVVVLMGASKVREIAAKLLER